jgi:two-component system sensor histidine kinase/response regulator
VRFAPNVPPRVVGDPGRIRQVILNLLGNAIKFTERGHVCLNVECQERDQTSAVIRFTVEDTGIGIAPDKLDRIFEGFTQADSSITRHFGGTGLGLSISKRLVEIMGGEMQVRSAQGSGSSFSFTLPLPVDTEGAQPLVPGAELSGVRVLLVDDNSISRLALQEYLAAWSLEHVSANSAAEGLEHLRAASRVGKPFHFAILDHEMPDMDGNALGRAIKSDSLLRDTMLILIASYGQRGDAKQAEEAGFSAYFVKPLRAEHLLNAMQTLCSARDSGRKLPLVTRRSLAESARTSESQLSPQRVLHACVLLVEDNTVNQKVAQRMLERMGCSVDVAKNGCEAVEKFSSGAYDAVMMDCQMPVMDGFEATREIRRHQGPGSHCPIIAMTAGAMEGDRERCLGAGMDDYVAKPVVKSELVRALKGHLPESCWSEPTPVDCADIAPAV